MRRLFYYKMRQKLITKWGRILLQNATVLFKKCELLQNATILLQNATVITKCDVYYKLLCLT